MSIKGIYWGSPKINDYYLILDYFSNTKINSIKTSSVPLAQYWQDSGKKLAELEKNLGFKINNAELCFEYPTKSYGSNRASMTDLMIIGDDLKIAVEAKYTEYAKGDYEAISKWLESGSKPENRVKVLKYWKDMIKPFADFKEDEINSIPYQLLHRTASACCENNGRAVVLYQIFYDTSTDSKLDKFIKELESARSIIKPKENLHFVINKIKVDKIHEEVKEKDFKKEEVFQFMKRGKAYYFGKSEFIRCD